MFKLFALKYKLRMHVYVRRMWRLLHRMTESSGGFQLGILTCSVEILWEKQGVICKRRQPWPISWVSSGQSLGLQVWHPVLPCTQERGGAKFYSSLYNAFTHPKPLVLFIHSIWACIDIKNSTSVCVKTSYSPYLHPHLIRMHFSCTFVRGSLLLSKGWLNQFPCPYSDGTGMLA